MSTEVITLAASIIRAESLRKRNGLSVSKAKVELAWRAIMAAGMELDPKITRRDQALTVCGLDRRMLYG